MRVVIYGARLLVTPSKEANKCNKCSDVAKHACCTKTDRDAESGYSSNEVCRSTVRDEDSKPDRVSAVTAGEMVVILLQLPVRSDG